MTYFRQQARAYAASRPTYPTELYQALAKLAPNPHHVWDCGTGSGQAAVDLTHFFDAVTATDTSAEQLAFAPKHPRIQYIEAPAESVPLDDASVDLITVASALHWFELEAFYAEAKRVLRPGGVIAAWAYNNHTTPPEIRSVTRRLSRELLADFWPQQNHDYTWTNYATLPFPFTPIEHTLPSFTARASLTLPQYQDYMRSWSATQRYINHHGHDPVDLIAESLQHAWGADETVDIEWPLFFKIGSIPQ